MDEHSHQRTITVGVLVFDEVELLDLAGPCEVFGAAAEVAGRERFESPPLFRVLTISQSGAPVRTRAGLSIFADHSFADHPPIDLLVVPGGDVSGMLADPDVALWIASVDAGCEITASVCTGAFLLAQAGLLDGRRATTHWEDVDGLSSQWPTIEVLRDVRWVDEGRIVTAAGVSAGIDMALHLVERLAGRELALRTARHMEYTWAERA